LAQLHSQGVLDRYRQVLPKFIFSETEVVYAGKVINMVPKITEVAQDLSSKGLEHVILLPSVKTGSEATQEAVRSVFLRSVFITCRIAERTQSVYPQ
jgi:acetoacetyl-CoA synthetase